ncbi:MAG: type II secretion system protein [Phycisphaeraceae bacterium]|nr:type II secretion system protein [Phycisphaeraceae bacterium]
MSVTFRHPERQGGFRGFTLIEVLITIAIIALLMGMVLATLAKVRKSQEHARCLSNLRQLMDCMYLYAADYDGYGPDEESIYTWDSLLEPYVHDERIYACPADNDGTSEEFGTSYEIRDFITVDIDHPERSFLKKRLLEAKPSTLILLFDAMPDWHNPGAINAASIDGSARAYTLDEYEKNLEMPVQ